MEKKSKRLEIGTVLRGDNGEFIVLGNEKNPNKKFAFTVQLRVLDGDGNILATTSNPLLSMLDPRTRPGITEEQRDKIPSKVVSKLFVKVPEDQA